MEWSDVEVFLAVARHSSLGAAARSLGISHPTVGRRLRALEAATGQVLFQRHSEGAVLTDAGEAVLRLAEDMEASALAMLRRLAGESERPEGVLRMSSPEWFAAYVLPPVIQELGRRYPRIVPEMIAGTRLFDLSRREADIVFRVVPFEEADIVQRRLMRVPYAVYVSSDAEDPVREGEDAALLAMDTTRLHYPDVPWLRQRLPRARTVLTTNSREVQAQLCARGMGVAVLPRPLGERVPGLREVDLGEAPPGRDVWMGYHQDLRRMDRLRAMADLAVQWLGDEPAE